MWHRRQEVATAVDRTTRRRAHGATPTSYETCRRMLRRHDPTYYWAVRRLPADVRPGVWALYGYVRTADELVDGPGRASEPVARRGALDRWQQRLDDAVRAGGSDHPVIASLVDAAARHALPLDELGIYMDSMRVDCGEVRMQTRADLDRYMRGSAGAVGRIMAALLDAPASSHEAFDRLGTAFQLTNFIRDVREDYSLGRIYLAAEDRARLGVDEATIARGEATAGFRTLLAEEVARARERFEQGRPAGERMAPAVRRGMRLARGVYLGVLDRVEAVGYDVLRPRARLAPWRAGALAVLGLARSGV